MMDLQTYLAQNKISKYHLSKISGVPKTTIMDICAGRSSIERCSAKTVRQLSVALGKSMEELMEMVQPEEKSYLDCGLPPFLQESIKAMKAAWDKKDNGRKYLHWDCDFCNLQSDINIAETGGLISSEQAWYLREKYLRMNRSENQ